MNACVMGFDVENQFVNRENRFATYIKKNCNQKNII